MPLLNLFTSAPLPAQRGELLARLSRLVATALDKPEEWVMVALEPRAEMSFGGTTAPALYAELKNVGTFSPDDTTRLSRLLCDALADGFGVARERVYIEFSNADGALWGWNGETFA